MITLSLSLENATALLLVALHWIGGILEESLGVADRAHVRRLGCRRRRRSCRGHRLASIVTDIVILGIGELVIAGCLDHVDELVVSARDSCGNVVTLLQVQSIQQVQPALQLACLNDCLEELQRHLVLLWRMGECICT